MAHLPTMESEDLPEPSVKVKAGAGVSLKAAAPAAPKADAPKAAAPKADAPKATERIQQKVRKSKRRGTEVDFGADLDHTTSYKTEFMVHGFLL